MMSDYSELLPNMLFGEELRNELQILPEYDDSVKNLDASTRLLKLMDIYKVFVPQNLSLEIYHKLYMMTVMSLQQKGTVDATRQLNENHRAMTSNKEYRGIITGASSCTVIGPSGCGKTTSVQRVVEMLGGTITNTQPYRKIIPALIVSTPFDANYRGLLLEILICVDNELGTEYYKAACKSNVNAQQILGMVCQVAHLHIGTLILDEIQFLVQHRAGTTLYKMILQLINASGISVVMVGTEECLDYFDQAPQMARRTTGLQYCNMGYDVEFKELCQELFHRQYTKNTSELTEGIYVWLYEHSAGNIANLTALIHDAQELSIMDGNECLDITSLTKAYDNRMQMLHGYIESKKSKRKKTSSKPLNDIDILEPVETETITDDVNVVELAEIIKKSGVNAIETYKKYFNVEEVVV